MSLLFIAASAMLVAANVLAADNAPDASAVPSSGTFELDYLSNIRQVTSESDYGKAGEGYFSPDGKSIVYQATPLGYPFYQIFTQPLEGSSPAPVRISPGRGRTTCSFFTRGDGRHIIFASSHLDPNLAQTEADAIRQEKEDRASGHKRRYNWAFDKHMDVFEATREGKIVRRLTDTLGYDAECAFSPDGSQIVFCSDRDGDADLYIMNADGTGVRQITNAKGYDGGPFFSPDGKWVVFRSDRKKEHYLQIFVVSTDGKHEFAMTDNVGVNWAPYWHPSEPFIIWCGADHSKPGRPIYNLWMMRYEVDGEGVRPGNTIQITDNPAADVLPVFSPDGKQLMWTSNRTASHTSQLYIADFDLTAVKQQLD